MRLIVDRFEGKYAVCEKENLEMISLEIKDLPKGVKEGDVLIYNEEGFKIDKLETKKRRENIRKLMDDLWE